jgi:TolB-like protein
LSEDQRRLAAVAFTDMVGYTTLAEKDEPLALRVLEKHNALVRSILPRHGGREVKTIGDAFLLEFDSALEAVLCAIDIQAALSAYNGSAPAAEKVLVRIGIHVGDVVHREGDLLGDTVNIASRIVNLAEGGGICLSEQAFLQVRNKLQYRAEKMPKQILKNVELEMDLYQILLPWEQQPGVGLKSARNRIAILPFANISPDPNDGYFADGLTDELISALSDVQGLRVIARTSVNRYRNTDKGVRQIGSELQVPFILEGSVRKAGNRIRVNAQLIEVDSQEHVWSSRYERDLDNVFSIQSDIARSVVDSLKVTLLTGEMARIERKETDNLAAYVAYLKGRTLLHDRTEKAIKGAKDQFELAIKEDPSFARAYAGLADINLLLGDYLFSPFPTALEDAWRYVSKSLELDPYLAEVRASRANLLLYDYQFGEAEKEFRKSIELNPSYASAHHWYASCLEAMGRGKEAMAEVLVAEQLDPLSSAITISALYRVINHGEIDECLRMIRKLEEIDPGSPLVTEGHMAYHFARKDWENALLYLNKMIQEDPSDPYLDMDLAYIYAVTGRREEALKLVEKLNAVPESARVKGTLIATVYAGLGDLDQVFHWLEYCFENKEAFFEWFRGGPIFENVRADPRFGALLERANLPP